MNEWHLEEQRREHGGPLLETGTAGGDGKDHEHQREPLQAHSASLPSPLPSSANGQLPTRRPGPPRTRGHIARVLQRFGYDVTERALTDWSSEGYLPHPIGHGRGRGGGRTYTYEQRTIVHHAAVVYQLMRWRARGDYHFFLLWLLGHQAPTTPTLAEHVQALLRTPTDATLTYLLEGFDLEGFDVASAPDVFAALSAMLHQRDHPAGLDVREGADAPEALDALDEATDEMTPVEKAIDHVNERISEHAYATASALRRRRSLNRTFSPAGIEHFVEVMDNTLYNPSFTWLSDDLVRGILGEMTTPMPPVRQPPAPAPASDTSTPPSSGNPPAQGAQRRSAAENCAAQSDGDDRTDGRDDATAEFAPALLRIIRFIHAHWSVPHLDAALAHATPSQLDQARKDLMQAVRLFQSFWSLGSAMLENARATGELARALRSSRQPSVQVASTTGEARRVEGADETLVDSGPASLGGGADDEDIDRDAWTPWGAVSSLESPAELIENLPYWTRMTWGYNLLFLLGIRALPALLALRQDGYGRWIDAVLAAVSTILTVWDETELPPSGEALQAAWYDLLALATQEDQEDAATVAAAASHAPAPRVGR